ncbi:hypothetical protein D0Z07_0066 [Hyphodiscus hymeniophilus]|uniref:Uncharacterized protein n=1 Tax=Hyphodiscus hymeniophilus TaxID=353542 RepID=A0A9P7B079_9HELO|nr:hypothetical protein D0Z07_0066 [Hyphodiscus hymeniophilus]
MAPKQQRIVVQKADPRRPAPKGYFSTAYNTLTSPENASVVRSVAVFGGDTAVWQRANRKRRAASETQLLLKFWQMVGGREETLATGDTKCDSD